MNVVSIFDTAGHRVITHPPVLPSVPRFTILPRHPAALHVAADEVLEGPRGAR